MVSKSFLENIQKFGKQISLKITIDNDVYEKDDIVSCTKSFSGDMFKSVMQYVDVELSGLVNVKDKEVQIKFGVCIEEPYEYISWGSFIVDNETIEKSIDKNTTKFTAYDYLCKACISYADMQLSYPITVKEYLDSICSYLGYVLETPTFINSTNVIDEEKFLIESYTFRDVLDHIAGASAGIIVMKSNKLYVKYPTDINVVIDENNLKAMSLLERFGPINSLVLSLQPQEDNYYVKDDESIEVNGLTEIKISNNEIMNKNREIFADEIFNSLKGFYFHPYEIESFGFGFFEPYDLIHIKDLQGNVYQSVVLNDTVTVTTGLNEKFYTNMPEVTETDYSKATPSPKELYKTILMVDKQGRKIEADIKENKSEIKRLSNSISVSLTLNYVTSQTFDINLNKYYPDYTVHPLKITAVVKDGFKESIVDAEVVFKRKTQADDEYTELIEGEVVNENVLTVSHNLTDSVEYIAYVTVESSGTTYEAESTVSINLNSLNDGRVAGSVCSIEATGDSFFASGNTYNPNNIVLSPQLFNCNFDIWSYSINLGLEYITIIKNTATEDDENIYTTNVEGILFINDTNEIMIRNDCELFDITNAIVFQLKADINGVSNTVVITKESDVNQQVNGIVNDMKQLVEQYNSLSLSLDGINNSITSKVEEMETKYNDGLTEISKNLSQIIQTSDKIEEQFQTLKEIVDENGGELQTITTYIRKTAKGIEVGELDAQIKTLMGTEYFAILFNEEEAMKLERNLLTIDKIFARESFRLNHSIFTSKEYGFEITWGGD